MARYIDDRYIVATMFHILPMQQITKKEIEIKSYKRGWNDALDAILKNAPSTDVRENVRGEWTLVTDRYGVNGEYVWKCSSCNKMTICKGDFCPNCGADMRGEEDDER